MRQPLPNEGKPDKPGNPDLLELAIKRYANCKCWKWDHPREGHAGRAVQVRAVSQRGQLSRPREPTESEPCAKCGKPITFPTSAPITNPCCSLECAAALKDLPAPTESGEAARGISGLPEQ